MKTISCFLSVVLFTYGFLFAQPTVLRQNSYGGTGYNGFLSMKLTSDTGLVLGGVSTSNIGLTKSENNIGLYDIWVVKTDSRGNKVWDRTLGGTFYEWIAGTVPTADGGYMVGGYSSSNVSGNKTQPKHTIEDGTNDYWLVKLDAAGNKLWDKVIGGCSNDEMKDIAATRDGGFILAGTSYSNNTYEKTEDKYGGDDIWVVKTDSLGNVEWDRDLGGTGEDAATRVIQAKDGGYLVAGSSQSGKSGNKTGDAYGMWDYWVIKLDAHGVIQWDRTMGGSDDDYSSSLLELPNGTYLVGGYSASAPSGNKKSPNKGLADYWLVGLDAGGNIIKDLSFGGSGIDVMGDMILTKEGDLLLSGGSASDVSGDKTEPSRSPGRNDCWMVKLDKHFVKVWDKTVGGAMQEDADRLLEASKNNYILLSNSYSTTSGDRTVDLKGEADGWVIQLRDRPDSKDLMTAAALPAAFEKDDFTVYPNPVKDVIYIRNNNTRYTYTLYSAMGKKLAASQVTGSGSMHVSHVPAGTYYLKDDHTKKSISIIVTH